MSLPRVAFLSFAIPLAAVSAERASPPCRPERIAKIAGWLADDPGDPASRITNRTTWAELAALPQAEVCIRRAEGLLAKPVPEMTDDMYLKWYVTDYVKDASAVPYYVPFWARRNAIASLTIAECLENRGRFLPKLVEYIRAVCAMRTWVQPSHDPKHRNFDGTVRIIDLGSAEMAVTLALCCDWMRGVLPEPVAAEMRAALDEQIFVRYRLFERGVMRPWWFFGDANWTAVCNGGVVRAALAVLPDRFDRAAFAEAAERTLPCYVNGFYSDGVCREGMDYWNYGFGNFLRAALALRRMTGGRLDVLSDSQCERNFAGAFGGMLEPWIAPHFADGGANPSPRVIALGSQVWPRYRTARADAEDIFAGGLVDMSVRAFEPGAVARARAPQREDDLRLPLRSWFPVAQVLVSRPSEGGRGGLSATMKGGTNGESHNHNDIGSYVVVLDGVEMAGDPGGAQYTKATFTARRYENPIIGSFGHPVPLPGGKVQSPGENYSGRVAETRFSAKEDVYVLDLAGAYALPGMAALTRTMTYRRDVQSVSFRDEVRFTAPMTFETPITTFHAVERGADDTEWFIVSERPARRLRVKITVDGGGRWRVKREKVPNPKRREPTRLAVEFDNPICEASVTFEFGVND